MPGRGAQRYPLHPSKRQWIALEDVLRRVQRDGRWHPRQPAQAQDLEGREAARLLVRVDQIERSAPQGPPQRSRVVQEHVRSASDGPGNDDEVVGSGLARHVSAALVPSRRAHERDIDAARPKLAIAGAPGAHHARLVDPQNSESPAGGRGRRPTRCRRAGHGYDPTVMTPSSTRASVAGERNGHAMTYPFSVRAAGYIPATGLAGDPSASRHPRASFGALCDIRHGFRLTMAPGAVVRLGPALFRRSIAHTRDRWDDRHRCRHGDRPPLHHCSTFERPDRA